MFLLLQQDLKSCKSTLEIFQSFFVFSPFTCLNVYHSGITCFLHLALSSHRSESYPPLEYDETHLSSIFSHKLNSLILLFCRSSVMFESSDPSILSSWDWCAVRIPGSDSRIIQTGMWANTDPYLPVYTITLTITIIMIINQYGDQRKGSKR